MKTNIAIILIFAFWTTCQSFSNQKRVDKIDQILNIYADEDLFSGVVLISEADNIIYKQAFGMANREWKIPMTTGTKFKIGSISKPFTALVIMQLIENGDISMDARIAKYLPEYKGAGKNKITIHHLLSHTSGLLNCLPPEQEAIKERLYHSLEDLVRYTEESDLFFEPGTGFHYSNFGYNMLALIAERVTGKSFTQLLDENIFQRADMTDSKQDLDPFVEQRMAKGYEYDLMNGYENTTFFDNSYAVGSGGISSTVEDLHKWYLAVLQDKLVSGKLKEKMYSRSDRGPYGYGWFIRNKVSPQTGDTLSVIEHSGSINGFGGYFAQIPEDSILVIILKNSRAHNYIRPVFAPALGNDIISILYDEDVHIPKKSIAMHLGRIIGAEGIDQALRVYQDLKSNNDEDYTFNESELNKLGIELLFKYKRIDDALKIFAVNLQEFPKSYNTYDSYAFTFYQKGDYNNSIKWYKKGFDVLSKFPGQNENASVKKDVKKAEKLISEMKEILKIETSK
jgi:CubicO group peptidase (beta-lactamase class C family)